MRSFTIIACLFISCQGYFREGSFFSHQKESALKVPTEFLLEKTCNTVLNGGGCKCIVHTKDTNCCCVGSNITEIPANFAPTLTKLYLYKTEITSIVSDAFVNYSKLQELVIDSANSLTHINADAFGHLRSLRKIYINNCLSLVEIAGGYMLKNNLKIKTVIIKNTGIIYLPRLEMTKEHQFTMDELDFSQNKIGHVGRDAFKNISAKTVYLSQNLIKRIDEFAFDGSRFVSLYLNDNKHLSTISAHAFVNILEIHKLDLSNTIISVLPEQGLKKIKHIVLKNTPSLKKLPSVLAFNNLNKAEFTYPYHCCFFKYVSREWEKGQSKQYSENYKEIQQRVCQRVPTEIDDEDSFWKIRRKRNPLRSTTTKALSMNEWINFDNWQSLFEPDDNQLPDTDDVDDQPPPWGSEQLGSSRVIAEWREECENSAVDQFYMNISCTPQPDALNPCEDIVGYPWLRYVIWIMWALAIIGNILVWIVITSVWTKRMKLHYFFMFNLAAGDFLTGCYLALLAIQDVRTMNEYYNFAVEWQTGWGCSIAGFLSVFASELSIMSMFMIAVEIYYNSKFGFYGKRMSPKLGYGLMSIGYAYSLLMASLPLFGVSSYQRSSICLPLAITGSIDRIYLVVMLSVGALAFMGMIANYIMINMMIRNPDMPSRSEDKQIFIRSLILIGTDMICWLPTLFFGLTAAAGFPLITLTNAKICLILFYPINSCANPWLYVLLTKIGRDVKNKVKHGLSFGGEPSPSVKNLNHYYNKSPHERDPLNHDQDHRFLQVNLNTQMTSLCSSPRSSSASQCTKSDSANDLLHGGKDFNPLHTWHNLSRSRNLSEQETCESIFMEVPQPKRHPHKPRVSSPPEMSDISENSSNSAEDGDKKKVHFKKGRFILERNPSNTPPTQRRRASVGRDSGTGDSLISNTIGKTPSSTSSLDAGGSSSASTPPETVMRLTTTVGKIPLNKKDVRVIFNLEDRNDRTGGIEAEKNADAEVAELTRNSEETETTQNPIITVLGMNNTPFTVKIEDCSNNDDGL